MYVWMSDKCRLSLQNTHTIILICLIWFICIYGHQSFLETNFFVPKLAPACASSKLWEFLVFLSKTQFDCKSSWSVVRGAWGRVQGWVQGSRQALPPSGKRRWQEPLLLPPLFCQTWKLVEDWGPQTLRRGLFECPSPYMVYRRCHIEGSGVSWTHQLHIYWHCFCKDLSQHSWCKKVSLQKHIGVKR